MTVLSNAHERQVMSKEPQPAARPDSDEIADAQLVPQMRMMLEAFRASPVRNRLLQLAGSGLSDNRSDRLRSNPAQSLERALLRCARAPGLP